MSAANGGKNFVSPNAIPTGAALPVVAGDEIQVGDLCYLETSTQKARPLDAYVGSGSAATDRVALAALFLGAFNQSHPAFLTSHIGWPIRTGLGVGFQFDIPYEADCDSATFNQGDKVAIVSAGAAAAGTVSAQKVVSTANPSEAIGEVLYKYASATTRVVIHLYGRLASVPSAGRTAQGGATAPMEILTAARAITAADNGKHFFLTLAGGFTAALPAAFLGGSFKFTVAVAPTTSYIITAPTAIQYGMTEERAGTAGVAGAGITNFNFVANQSIIADWVEYYSNGSKWFYRGMTNIAAGNTVS